MNIGGKDKSLASKLQEFLVEQKGEKGAAISAAIVKDGQLIAACTAGKRGTDGTPADIGDLYNLGSIAKIYCATAIMKLVEMGNIDLDIPIINYLPRFKMRDEHYRNITVRMLLNFSSGLPGSNYRNDTSDRWNGENRKEENYQYLLNAKLKAKPGMVSTYCNDGFELLAAIIEELSGKSYIQFLREYISIPLGADTTGVANVGIGNRRMMSCLGKKPEWLNCIGSGAIRSDLSDCARFGYLFIDSKNIIKKKYLDEMCKPQGKTFLKHDSYTPLYGFGWDTVEFRHWKLDLGESTLEKSGGVIQFDSELIVSSKYKLSAAISATSDCEADVLAILCDLIKITMNEKGIDISKKEENEESSKKENIKVQAIPEDIYQKHGMVYYSAEDVYKLEINDDKLFVFHYDGDGQWEREWWLPEMEWDGEKFVSDKVGLFFEIYDNNEYIILLRDGKYFDPLAQKCEKYSVMSQGWQNRIGKKYLASNISAYDPELEETAVIIDKVQEDGVILFIRPNDEPTIPAISCADDDTDMFINIPFASTDIYAPFIFKQDGIEYLRICGYIFQNVETLTEIKSGIIKSLQKEENVIYKIRSGMKLEFNKPDDVIVIIYNDDLSIVYNSHEDEKIPELNDGYITFANDGPMDFKVQVI